MYAYQTIYLLIFILLNSSISLGTENSNLSIEDAIKIALENNPNVLFAKKELEATSGRKLQLSAIPDLELEGEWVGIPYGSSLAQGEEAKIGLSQSFEFPGKQWLRGDVGNLGEEIAKRNLEKTKLLVISDVKKTYYKTVFSQKVVSNIESNIDLLKQILEITNIKFKTGNAGYLEIVRIKVELAKIKNELVESKRELVGDKRKLNLLLARKSDDQIILTSDISYVPFNKHIEQVKEEIMNKSNTLEIIELSLKQNEKSKTLSYMSLLPDFNFGLYKSRAGTIDGWGAEFKMNIPIYFWWKQTGEIKETSANLESSEIKLESTKRNIIGSVQNAYETVKSTEELVKNFEQIIIKEVEDELKSGITSYQNNQIDSLNLFDVYRTYKSTKIEYYRALYNYHISLAELEIAGEEKE